MIYQSKSWALIDKRYPLTFPELKKFRDEIENATMLVVGIVAWGEAIKKG